MKNSHTRCSAPEDSPMFFFANILFNVWLKKKSPMHFSGYKLRADFGSLRTCPVAILCEWQETAVDTFLRADGIFSARYV